MFAYLGRGALEWGWKGFALTTSKKELASTSNSSLDQSFPISRPLGNWFAAILSAWYEDTASLL